MASASPFTPGLLGAAIFLFHLPSLPAQVAGPLNEAAGSVGRVLGPQALGALISIEGQQGSPQPTSWDFTVADPTARNGVRIFRATPVRAAERAAADAGYPQFIPGGFFRWSDVKVDAFSAFHAADQEARAAMIGFDAVHYLLRAREGTNTPVWSLTLLDAQRRMVGRMEISADSAKVERRVWMRYGGPGKGLLRVEDSLAPYQAMQPAPPAPPQPLVPVPPSSLAPQGPVVPLDSPASPVYPPVAPSSPTVPGIQVVPPMPQIPSSGGAVEPIPVPPPTVPSAPGYTPLPP